MSDIWEEDAQDDCANQELRDEWNARRLQHFNAGYRDGVDAGRGQTLQEGFDRGYARGLDAGMAWGSAHGGLLMLDELRNKELITNEIQMNAEQRTDVMHTDDRTAYTLLCSKIMKESGLPIGTEMSLTKAREDQAEVLTAAQEAALKVLQELKKAPQEIN